MILKVQMPLYPSDAEALAYDEDRRHEWLLPVTDAIKEMVAGRPKSFWHATIVRGMPVFGVEAEWQSW